MLNFEKKGYIAIVVAFLVPLVLLGVKWTLDTLSVHRANMEKTSGDHAEKRCARQAALQVAKNWNPGLTLGQQKVAVMKVADAVYNANPYYFTDSVIGRAISGLNLKKVSKAKSGGKYDPLKVLYSRKAPEEKTIKYTTAPKYTGIYKASTGRGTTNSVYMMWRAVDVDTVDSSKRESDLDEIDEEISTDSNFVLKHHDIYTDITPYNTSYTNQVNNDMYFPNSSAVRSWRYEDGLHFTMDSKKSGSRYFGTTSAYKDYNTTITTSTYTVRENPNDDAVQISVKNDSIKVATDDDVGYAIPAECNADIVLAVPVNGAACNQYNRDAASSPSSGYPYGAYLNKTHSSSEKMTPIYEIGQACKAFVRDNFYHTRGIYMGLIPYSAKLSISPDKKLYANDEETFNESYFNSNPLAYDKICGAALYYTRGERGKKLATPPVWGGNLTGCPIMCRRGTRNVYAEYGNNPVYSGLLHSTDNPTTNAATKYGRMNLHPCYLGYSNFLSMQCDKVCKAYWPNPFYMIELTADMTRICEFCNALCPPHKDNENVSNFLFIPFEWANNFFQNWTNDPKCDASANNAAEEDQQLSRQSKNTSGRKKALILIVNKPDWFEPGELTYLGFDNDASEFSIVESDKISFNIDYGDTTKRFLDGSYFNTNEVSDYAEPEAYKIDNTGLIAGPKKILKYTQTSGSISYDPAEKSYKFPKEGAGRLSFPQKGTVLIKVKASSPPSIPTLTEWKLVSKTLGSNGSNFAYGNGIFVAIRSMSNGSTSYSVDDGKTWTRNEDLSSLDFTSSDERWFGVTYGNGKFVSVHNDGYFACSSDGKNWSLSENKLSASTTRYISYYNGKFMTTSMTTAYTSNDLTHWENMYTKNSGIGLYLVYGNGIYVHLNIAGWISVSEDQGKTWSSYEKNPLGSGTMNHLHFIEGNFITLSNKACYVSENGKIWKTTPVGNLFDILSYSGFLCYAQGRLYALDSYGTLAVCEKPFLKVSQSGIITINGNTYSIDGEKTIVVEQSEISDTKDSSGNYYIDINTSNVDLVFAEIMNFEVEKIEPVTTNYYDVELCKSGSSSTTLRFGTRSYQEAYQEEYQEAYEVITPAFSSYSSYKPTSTGLWAIASSGSYYAAVGGDALSGGRESSVVTHSSGGTSWSSGSIDCSKMLRGVCGTGAKFIAVGHGGALFDSSNGSSWSKGTTLPRSAYCIRYAGGIFVVATASGYVVRSASDNGWGWDSKSTGFSGDVYKIAYGNSTYVAVGSGGGISTSSNSAKNWTKRTSPTSNNLESVGYGNGVFVAGGSGGVIITSSNNGVSWTKRTSPCSSTLRDVVYCNGVFCAVGGGDVAVSVDNGQTWEKKTAPSSGLQAAAAIGDYIYMGSSSGYVYRTSTSKETKYRTAYRTAYRTITVNCVISTTKTDFVLSQKYGSTFKVNSISSSSLTWDSSLGAYYYDLSSGYTGNFAVRLNNKSMQIDDLIAFCDSTTSKNSSYRSITYSGSGNTTDGLFTCSSGTGIIALSKRGKLKLKIMPSLSASSGSFRFTTGSDTSTKTINGTSEYTIEVKDQDKNGNNREVRFSMTNIVLLTAEFIHDPIPNFTAFSNKNYLRSNRGVDYSSSTTPIYNSSIIGTPNFAVYYDKNRERFCISSNNSNKSVQYISPNKFPGDMQSITNDFGKSAAYSYCTNNGYSLSGSMKYGIYSPGCMRIFTPCWRSSTYKYMSMEEKSGEDSTNAGGAIELLTHEITYPLNYVLWKNGYQSPFYGSSGTTPTEAVKQVTIEACKKLKRDWGLNIKVYVIKYRAQEKYKTHPFSVSGGKNSQSEASHDYSYIENDCADKLYDNITTQNELKDALDKIAKDIKNFAGYKEARIEN